MEKKPTRGMGWKIKGPTRGIGWKIKGSTRGIGWKIKRANKRNRMENKKGQQDEQDGK